MAAIKTLPSDPSPFLNREPGEAGKVSVSHSKSQPERYRNDEHWAVTGRRVPVVGREKSFSAGKAEESLRFALIFITSFVYIFTTYTN